MSQERGLSKFYLGWQHFCECIDFNYAKLDAEAVDFMLKMPEDVRKMCKNTNQNTKEVNK